MPVFIKAVDGWAEVTPHYREDGSWKRFAAVYFRTGLGWQLIYSTLKAHASPVFLSGVRRGAGFATTSGSASVMVTGGVAASYSWSRTGGNSRISAVDSLADTTAFSATLAEDESITADFVCTVSGGGDTVSTNAVSVTLTSFSQYEPPPDDGPVP